MAGGNISIDRIKFHLDNLFLKYVLNSKIKIHGFGITSLELLLRYPWYSVDSSTWKRKGIYGCIIVPKFKNNEFQWLEKPTLVKISDDNNDRNMYSCNHYSSLNEKQKEIVDYYIRIAGGYNIGKSEIRDGKKVIIEEGLCNSHYLRDYINVYYFNMLQKKITEYKKNIGDEFFLIKEKNRRLF